MDLSLWLPLRELSSWSDYADHLGAKTKAVILGVAHGCADLDIGHAESACWLRALSMDSRLLRWIACSNSGLPHDRLIGALDREFHLRRFVADHRGQGTLVRGGGHADKHLEPPLLPFRRLHGAQGTFRW